MKRLLNTLYVTSPDRYLSLDGENVVVLHNEKNQGFSANVNKGMLYSDRDVILLNSDTIVTKGWVEKIQACAYLSRRNATVTPLSIVRRSVPCLSSAGTTRCRKM